MFRSHPLRSSIGAAFAVLACLATDVRAGVASMVTPNPSYVGNPLRFTKFLPGGACYDEARILELSTSGTTITVRYAVDSIPPMICGVSPPLGLEIDIGPREPGLREIFGTVAHDCPFEPNFDVSRTTNATDLWWASPAASEAGWGIAIADQARADGRPVFFATWFTYDHDRRPLWLSTTAELDSQTGTFKGALLRTRGPAFNTVPFPPLGAPGGVTATTFGTAEFTVAYDRTMRFTSTVNRVQRDKRITRQVFAAPRAVCRYEVP